MTFAPSPNTLLRRAALLQQEADRLSTPKGAPPEAQTLAQQAALLREQAAARTALLDQLASLPSVTVRRREMRRVLADAQGDWCAICHARGGLVIDHDHETGEVRGLLCQACNALLTEGRTPDLLCAAACYLRHPPAEYLHLPYHQ